MALKLTKKKDFNEENSNFIWSRQYWSVSLKNCVNSRELKPREVGIPCTIDLDPIHIIYKKLLKYKARQI